MHGKASTPALSVPIKSQHISTPRAFSPGQREQRAAEEPGARRAPTHLHRRCRRRRAHPARCDERRQARSSIFVQAARRSQGIACRRRARRPLSDESRRSELPETCSSPLHPSSSTRESRPPAPSSSWSDPQVCTTPATTSPAIVFVFLVVCTKPAATLVLSPSSGSPSAVGKEPESAATPAPSRGREASRRSGGEGHDARFVFGGAAG